MARTVLLSSRLLNIPTGIVDLGAVGEGQPHGVLERIGDARMPLWDQTGKIPDGLDGFFHFTSSTAPGSAGDHSPQVRQFRRAPIPGSG